ncbi:Negative elongation factor A [Sciurus carolinensis]|uniref:Negative elongation factor A n=1 Tax=Sciurus carolinensis TaxID=30640 RepID=A0AA41N915_SCICA|nr:Negative elongation factor A [Sciurus carolinensis]
MTTVIDNIRLCFHRLSLAMKLKLLLPTLRRPSCTVDEMKDGLMEIVQLATLHSYPWALMVADILKSFPDKRSLNLDLEEQNPNIRDTLGELRGKHFQLKQKPKSATLREERLQKSMETAQQLKRSAGVPDQGDMIQIKLSEHTENLPKAGGQDSTTKLVDTMFEMNYATGQGMHFKKYKPMTNVS